MRVGINGTTTLLDGHLNPKYKGAPGRDVAAELLNQELHPEGRVRK